MIEFESNFPNRFDDTKTLHTVKDMLKVQLAEDYHPGDTRVIAASSVEHFPTTGFITLIDKCGNSEESATTFYYQNRKGNEFYNLEILPSSIDFFKPKKITWITQQVMAENHNSLKSAIIAIQKFLGTKHSDDKNSIFGRINELQKLLYVPKAWFEVDRNIGIAPFTVTFESQSSGTSGPVGAVGYSWNFGDGTFDAGLPKITHTYEKPGTYTVSLEVENQFGKDSIEFKDMVRVKAGAPEEAIIELLPKGENIKLEKNKIRIWANELLNIEIPEEKNELKTMAGEKLDENGRPVDPIISYTWNLADELAHQNSKKTKAIYRVGGLYDLVVRTDTQLGSYRITTLENAIDVVEEKNLWLWTHASPNEVQAHEFGLFSETFKAKSNDRLRLNVDDSFINIEPQYKRMRKEFWRNNGATALDFDKCMLFYATGRNASQSVEEEKIEFVNYSGFTDVYTKSETVVKRPWNWASFISPYSIYFFLGDIEKRHAATSATNQIRSSLNLASFAVTEMKMESFHYVNGAHELMRNQIEFDEKGKSKYGHFSIYRTAWKDHNGFLLRSRNVGEFFHLVDFYKTEGMIMEPFINIVKVADLPASGVQDGQLVALKNGIYFFSKSGSIYLYNDLASVWETHESNFNLWGGFEEDSDSLVAAGEDGVAYLSFDRPNSFFKFDELDLTFKTLSDRPAGKQWLMTIF